ncbi:MAG: hypothetical protein ACTSWG_10595 [Candidatus Helarchaeota archaeon]
MRLYYPYEDINGLSYDKLVKRSDYLLRSEHKAILQELKKQGFTIEKTFFNLTNAEVKEKTGLAYV